MTTKCALNIFNFTVLFIALVSISQITMAQDTATLIMQLDSADIHIYQGVNYKAFKQQVRLNPVTWRKAIALLADKARLRKMLPGRYAIDGDNAYAKVTKGPSKISRDVQWESHRKYIDLQYVISGKERIFVAKLDSLQLTQEYDEATDVAHYDGAGNSYLATPAVLFLFFPSDAHRTGIRADGCDTVRKLVIKILMK